jgi:integrase
MKPAHPNGYKSLSPLWIDTIRPSKANGIQSVLQQLHEYYTVEEMLKITNTPVDSLLQERDRAAACFLFLSGMCTKIHKAAVTPLISIPELWSVIRAWDAKVRKELPKEAAWYAPINHWNTGFIHSVRSSEGRRNLLAHGFEMLCEIAGVTYHSPHKFRHGHAVFALKQVKSLADLKAISQNLMHSNVGITDGI